MSWIWGGSRALQQGQRAIAALQRQKAPIEIAGDPLGPQRLVEGRGMADVLDIKRDLKSSQVHV
jgi:hypothetical protein